MITTTSKDFRQYYYQFSWIQLLRPMTLSGTISPICVGTLYILWRIETVQVLPFLLLLTGAVFIQMATNIWNDYFDFKEGQDQEKWQTDKKSGHHPAYGQLPYLAITLTIIAIFSGIWLAVLTTFWIIPIGIGGIAGGFYYSAGNPSLSQIGLGELTAALLLGFATTILPFLTQNIFLVPDMFLIAVPFALLISTMILTNNIRDIEKDKQFRNTIAMTLGRKKAIQLLKILLTSIYGYMMLLIFTNLLPWTALFVLFALPIVYKLLHCFQTTTDLACMKYAAWHHWIFGLSYAAALLLAMI